MFLFFDPLTTINKPKPDNPKKKKLSDKFHFNIFFLIIIMQTYSSFISEDIIHISCSLPYRNLTERLVRQFYHFLYSVTPLRVSEWGGKHDKQHAFYAYVHHLTCRRHALLIIELLQSHKQRTSPFLNEESTLIGRGVKSRHTNVYLYV